MINLSLDEARILGVLIEKAVTTPEQYPLSLNSVTIGCNQKTNRDPVLSLEDSEVQESIDSLIKKNLVSEVRFGGRVPKYQHRFSGTEFSEFKFNKQETGLLCLLFLRGPQTPGELRSRSNRLCAFSDVLEVEAVLQGLVDYAGGPYVLKLAREPGRREARYAHLLSGEVDQAFLASNHSVAPNPSEASRVPSSPTHDFALEERIELLELTVEELQETVTNLQNKIDSLIG